MDIAVHFGPIMQLSMASWRKHWFLGILVILLAVWGGLALAYLSGAEGVTVRARGGQSATLDFMRDQEEPVVLGLTDNVGLELADGGSEPGRVTGHIVSLESVPVPLCVCGESWSSMGYGDVGYRQGDWLFRAPKELMSRESLDSGSESWREAVLTLAYNPTTRERVLQTPDDTLEQQRSLLAEHGLDPSEAQRLDLDRLSDLKVVSMRSERCMIYFGAFVLSVSLWLLIGGPIALLQRRRRRARAGGA
ncbi:hypothetical protein PPSIR1_06231 [Plesiocystis pacifica SIR-1]|uniref:Uncharacterized protein n=1 Tax=Plesiocystis pacifica SIR-1 TaxID=391625 RepID=A6G6X1_9BACT|nr:hypothetical protein PPSIR1_06231 [Plesiocystis pacifica SIR-1]